MFGERGMDMDDDRRDFDWRCERSDRQEYDREKDSRQDNNQ